MDVTERGKKLNKRFDLIDGGTHAVKIMMYEEALLLIRYFGGLQFFDLTNTFLNSH